VVFRYQQEAQLMPTNPRDAFIEVSQGQQTRCHSMCYRYGFLLVFYSNFVPKTHRFWTFDFKKCRDHEIRSLTVIRTDTDRSATYDFLFTLHSSNHEPISYRFRDKRRFQSKIANFPTPCIYRPRCRGSPWSMMSAHGVKRLE